MPERRAPSTAGSDDSGAAAVRPEEQRHRWRRNPALSPQVKLAPHYISTGGDMPGARVPSTALSDDGGAPDGKSKEHRHTRWQNPPSSPPVNLRPQITSMGGARTAPRGSPPGQSPGVRGGSSADRRADAGPQGLPWPWESSSRPRAQICTRVWVGSGTSAAGPSPAKHGAEGVAPGFPRVVRLVERPKCHPAGLVLVDDRRRIAVRCHARGRTRAAEGGGTGWKRKTRCCAG